MRQLKEAALFTLKFKPETTQYKKSSGAKISMPPKRKLVRASDFRLQIDGLDCTRVNRIESFTVIRKVVTASDGSGGGAITLPTRVEFPNITLSLPEAFAEDWFEWAKDFIVDGNNTNAQEKSGTLSFLEPTLTTARARIKFFNLGICRLTPEKNDGTAVPRVRAELYCERMEYEIV